MACDFVVFCKKFFLYKVTTAFAYIFIPLKVVPLKIVTPGAIVQIPICHWSSTGAPKLRKFLHTQGHFRIPDTINIKVQQQKNQVIEMYKEIYKSTKGIQER